MLHRVKTNIRSLLNAIRLMKTRGFSLAAILCWHLPMVTLLRTWRVIARPINKHLLHHWANYPRFTWFINKIEHTDRPRLFVIVMPFTLHYLLPCLALLQPHSQLILLSNGAHRWEKSLLQKKFPTLRIFNLWTLPFTSIVHSEVINLLLKKHPGNFGLVDHDCYIFDENLIEQLVVNEDEALLAYLQNISPNVDLPYPLTHFLFFHTQPLRRIMRRYGIDASLYRKAPASTHQALISLGITAGEFLKHYHNFYDTLHILICMALAEGLNVRYLTSAQEHAVIHVGGTSLGTHHTKGLYELYIHSRFLELLNDPELNRRYAFLTAPLCSSTEIMRRRSPYDPAWRQLPVVDALIQQLRIKLENWLESN